MENIETNQDTTQTQETNQTQESITLTPEELNAKLQSETDKRVSQALNTARAKWEKEFNEKLETEKQEAEKLARLSAAEREKVKFEKEKEQFLKEKAEMERTKLEMETIKQLSTENIPTEFSKYIVGTTADETLNNINEFKDVWQQAIEKAVESRLIKSKTPGLGNKQNTSISKEQFKSMSYLDKLKLANENPDLYKSLKE